MNIAHHPGNERFRTLVTGRQDDSYCTSYSATEKRAVAEEIIKHIKSLDPPGRFLKRDGRGQVSRGLKGPWEELTEKEAIKKTCQALRDCNRVDRQGYAAGVAPPQDVMISMKKRAMTGMTGKQHAAAAAAASAAAVAANMGMKRGREKQYVFEENQTKYFQRPGFRDSHLSQESIENITRVVDDTHPRVESMPRESLPKYEVVQEQESQYEWKKQRTECHAYPPPSEPPLPLPVLPVYDSTHQEFHKVWTQTDKYQPHEPLSSEPPLVDLTVEPTPVAPLVLSKLNEDELDSINLDQASKLIMNPICSAKEDALGSASPVQLSSDFFK